MAVLTSPLDTCNFTLSVVQALRARTARNADYTVIGVTLALCESLLTGHLSVPRASPSCLLNNLWGSHDCMTSLWNAEGVVGPSGVNDDPCSPRWVKSQGEKRFILYQSWGAGGWRQPSTLFLHIIILLLYVFQCRNNVLRNHCSTCIHSRPNVIGFFGYEME